jgi:hypothetical protein
MIASFLARLAKGHLIYCNHLASVCQTSVNFFLQILIHCKVSHYISLSSRVLNLNFCDIFWFYQIFSMDQWSVNVIVITLYMYLLLQTALSASASFVRSIILSLTTSPIASKLDRILWWSSTFHIIVFFRNSTWAK